jgi:predicted MFS family arabinose efflux permease
MPYASDQAAPLFLAAAVGMLAGDVLMGRVFAAPRRLACTRWLRMLLAAPFLVFLWHPSVPLAALLTGLACIGYAASLGQQELLVKLTPASLSGQVLGVEAAARVTCQGLAAALAGTLAEVAPPGATIALLALASLLVSVGLTRALARAERHAVTVGAPSSYSTVAGPSPAQAT